jgi:hypothetical protein
MNINNFLFINNEKVRARWVFDSKTTKSSYFIQMFFYFIYFYNLELNIAPSILYGKFQSDSNICVRILLLYFCYTFLQELSFSMSLKIF